MEFYKLYYRIHNRDDWWRLKNYIAWLAFCKLTFRGDNSMKTTIGFLKHGDLFLLDGIKYKVGHLIENTNGYVACVDVETKKVKRFYIDTTVEIVKE